MTLQLPTHNCHLLNHQLYMRDIIPYCISINRYKLAMQAYLWDGIKQIKGTLSVKEDHLVFDLDDFNKTDLHLSIPVQDIVSTRTKAIYNIAPHLVEVITANGSCNAFVMEHKHDIDWLISIKDYLNDQ